MQVIAWCSFIPDGAESSRRRRGEPVCRANSAAGPTAAQPKARAEMTKRKAAPPLGTAFRQDHSFHTFSKPPAELEADKLLIPVVAGYGEGSSHAHFDLAAQDASDAGTHADHVAGSAKGYRGARASIKEVGRREVTTEDRPFVQLCRADDLELVAGAPQNVVETEMAVPDTGVIELVAADGNPIC